MSRPSKATLMALAALLATLIGWGVQKARVSIRHSHTGLLPTLVLMSTGVSSSKKEVDAPDPQIYGFHPISHHYVKKAGPVWLRLVKSGIVQDAEPRHSGK